MKASVIAALAALAAAACGQRGGPPPPERGPEPVRDAVTAPRVVTLTPSATEVVAALDATALLVGVDDYSTSPEAVQALPKVGSFLAPNLEAIAALAPTLVIADDIHGRATRGFAELGIATLACPMHTLPDVKAALARVGAALGREAQARRRIAEIDLALDATAARRPARRPRVLLVIDRNVGGLGGIVAAGPGSWLDELVAVAGGDNVLAGAGVRYPKISREEILRARPDVILDVSYVADPAAPAADWAGLDVPAVTAGRVRAAKEPYLLAPSPRVAEALARIEELLR